MANLPLVYILAALALPRSIGFDIIYLIVGVLPSIIWLWVYLRQDKHPEPKLEILSVFLMGAFITAPAVYIELFFTYDCAGAGASCVPGLFYRLGLQPWMALVLSGIIGVAFVEEFSKYIVVWLKEQAIGNNSQLDEPVDFIIYMVVAALGFAAAENLLFLLKYNDIQAVFGASLIRSLTAILVHTLCSGILGYYMAMTFCHRDKKIRYLVGGLVMVSLLHGLYDLSIIGSGDNLEFLLLVLGSIIAMGYLLCTKLQDLKKMKSVCTMRLGK
jgi:RsiW-degrading membrane proteinase PrsW (M82 family)